MVIWRALEQQRLKQYIFQLEEKGKEKVALLLPEQFLEVPVLFAVNSSTLLTLARARYAMMHHHRRAIDTVQQSGLKIFTQPTIHDQNHYYMINPTPCHSQKQTKEWTVDWKTKNFT